MEINKELEQPEFAEELPDSGSFLEQITRQTINSYQEQFNKANDKYEVAYYLTITIHKVATEQGNKDAAYLRLDKNIRTKGSIDDNDWEPVGIVHQEVYFFKNIKDQADPRAIWRDELYARCITRLVWAGLEYAEFLRRTKQMDLADREHAKDEVEERLNDIGLVKSEEMPKPLTPADEEYAKWVKTEKAKEGLV